MYANLLACTDSLMAFSERKWPGTPRLRNPQAQGLEEGTQLIINLEGDQAAILGRATCLSIMLFRGPGRRWGTGEVFMLGISTVGIFGINRDAQSTCLMALEPIVSVAHSFWSLNIRSISFSPYWTAPEAVDEASPLPYCLR